VGRRQKHVHAPAFNIKQISYVGATLKIKAEDMQNYVRKFKRVAWDYKV
jgi:hypothetical protein